MPISANLKRTPFNLPASGVGAPSTRSAWHGAFAAFDVAQAYSLAGDRAERSLGEVGALSDTLREQRKKAFYARCSVHQH
jgi:hypothetical protein